MVGRTLSHYRITASIGAGGMDEAYRATDMKLGREVALKVLPTEAGRDFRIPEGNGLMSRCFWVWPPVTRRQRGLFRIASEEDETLDHALTEASRSGLRTQRLRSTINSTDSGANAWDNLKIPPAPDFSSTKSKFCVLLIRYRLMRKAFLPHGKLSTVSL
jgi:hypothetical protein